ncbi:MAG TPA: hypothetical protein VKV40_11240 [Ktedonobacteraceae bacterium]|nr:hypothetical protein [Ktedonobacteraceae bacterium]
MSDYVPTFADLCNALAEGQITATIDGSMYEFSALELRRYLNRFRSLPIISSPTQAGFSHADSGSSSSWSGSSRSSVA